MLWLVLWPSALAMATVMTTSMRELRGFLRWPRHGDSTNKKVLNVGLVHDDISVRFVLDIPKKHETHCALSLRTQFKDERRPTNKLQRTLSPTYYWHRTLKPTQRQLSPTYYGGHQSQQITEDTKPNKMTTKPNILRRTPSPTQWQLSPTYYVWHQAQHNGN